MSAFPEGMFETQKTDLGLINKMNKLRKDINVFISGLCDDEIKYDEYIAVKDFIDVASYLIFPERYNEDNSISLSFSNAFFLTTCTFENCDIFKVNDVDKLEDIKPCFKKLFHDLDNFSNGDSKNRLIKFLMTLDKELEEYVKLELDK